MAVKQNGVLATFTPTVSKYTNFTVPANANTTAGDGSYNIYTCPEATLTSGKLIVSNNTGGALNIDVGIVEYTDMVQFDALAAQPNDPNTGASYQNYGAFSFTGGTPTSYATSIAIEGGGVTGSGFNVGEQVTWTNTNPSNIINPATNNNNHTAYVRYWDSANSKLWLDRMSHPSGLEITADTTFTGATSGSTISAGPSFAGSGGYQGWSGNVRFYDSLNGRLYLMNHEFRNNLNYNVIFDPTNENREQTNNNLNRSLGRLYRPVATTQNRFAATGNTQPATEFISNNGIELLVSSVTKCHAEQFIVQDKAVNDNEIFELNGIVLGTYQSLYVKSTGALTFTFIGFEEVAEIPS